jgi:hypothetical protein
VGNATAAGDCVGEGDGVAGCERASEKASAITIEPKINFAAVSFIGFSFEITKRFVEFPHIVHLLF